MRTEKILVVDDDAAVRRLIWKSITINRYSYLPKWNQLKTKDIVSRVTFDLFIFR